MSFIENFNKALQKFPAISRDLEKKIKLCRWPEQKTDHAIQIVHQLQRKDIVYSLGTSVFLSYVNIILTPSDCNIAEKNFSADNISKAYMYMDSLLGDINELSPRLKFTLAGTYSESGYIKFQIEIVF